MNIKLLINGALKYQKSIDRLFESISAADNKFNNHDIIIVRAGGERYEMAVHNDILNIIADNNSFDFTALFAVIDLDITADGFLYIHDTCVMGKDFFNKANSKGYSYEMIPLKHGASMNIGYYSKRCLKKHYEVLLPYKNKDYSPEGLLLAKKRAIEYEDLISNKYKHEVVYQDFDPTRSVPVDYYGTGTDRIVEYYAGLDLYKIKANWGIKKTLVLEI